MKQNVKTEKLIQTNKKIYFVTWTKYYSEILLMTKKSFEKNVSFLLWSVCVCVCKRVCKKTALWLIRAFVRREQWNTDKEKASPSSEGLPTCLLPSCHLTPWLAEYWSHPRDFLNSFSISNISCSFRSSVGLNFYGVSSIWCLRFGYWRTVIVIVCLIWCDFSMYLSLKPLEQLLESLISLGKEKSFYLNGTK